MSNHQPSLMQAIQSGRLPDFIAQEKARSVGPIDESDFDALAAKVIRAERSGDQASYSLPADGSPGT
jgi:hypothetical protein